MARNGDVTASLVFKSFTDELAYNHELAQSIRPLFIRSIPAVQLTDLQCISDKLTEEDIQKVRRRQDCEGSNAGARMLLDNLMKKPSWFPAFLQALDCREVKLADLKPQFLRLKEEVDKQWIERICAGSAGTPTSSVNSASSGTQFVDRENAVTNCWGFGEIPEVVNPSAHLSRECSQPGQESRGTSWTSEETIPKTHNGSVTHSETSQARPEDENDDDYESLLHPSLLSESWFHGNMTRTEAHDILKHRCLQSFLVRYSLEKKHFCISIVGHKKVINLRVQEDKSTGVTQYYLDNSQETFPTITELVNYFKVNALGTHDGHIYLCNPVLRCVEGAENGNVLLCNGRAEEAKTESSV